ncbi:DUF3618 domain-containing protein [Histidinibacterium aquaticum]|uniref:DUF3618 domain-containing protein n=1 Tax=Histidinibacterium aquaticum TaxID=2613962 RepID=A0A5J5GQ53_9RHOB|nr:DUF3618 domain-containing protein [Histidinibacterium aquaticum]KAA9010479.1 DUF3618 domain-containing protein [Histidinibacterium aquaticum]
MSADRSSADIEKQIDRERSELGATLTELGNRMTVDHLFREVTTQIRTHGGEFGKSAGTQVKNNPMALAITGIGLGWLLFGSNRPPQQHAGTDSHLAEPARERYGYPAELTETSRYRARAAAARPGWYERAGDALRGSGNGSDSSGSWRDSASNGLNKARGKASAAGHDMSARAGEARTRLREGTDHLSEEARERVIAARERAMYARERAGRGLSQGADTAADFYDRQPLVAGVLALAAGALVAGMAQRTRWEDENVGPYRDDLVDEAERIYREESEKAAAVANRARGEVETIAEEKREQADASAPGDKSAVKQAGDEVRGAAERIRDAGEDEAKRQELGKPQHH